MSKSTKNESMSKMCEQMFKKFSNCCSDQNNNFDCCKDMGDVNSGKTDVTDDSQTDDNSNNCC